MPNLLPGSSSRAPIPDRKDSDASPTFVHPHPRHGGRRLQFARPTSANHPVYLDHHLHVVHNDDHAPADHYGTPYDDDRSRTRGANVSPTTGNAGGDAVSCTHRGSDSQALGPVRPRSSAVGGRDRVARIELPSRRDESDRVRGPVSACDPLAFRSVCESRVLRPADSGVRAGSEHRGGRSPVLVVGTFALAIVIWTVILWAVL